MEKINIPSELEEVGKQAFIYCAALEELNLPDTVTRIGVDAFEGVLWIEEDSVLKN